MGDSGNLAFRPLTADEVDVRVGKCTENGCSLLLYKDARCDMRILDEVLGPERWQIEYRMVGSELFCRVGVSLLECYEDWVWKESNGTPSNMESEKGRASDAFKRACFMWGIGRELYTAPFIWVGSDKCSVRTNERSGKWACYDRFEVSRMEVEGGRITALEIVNAKTGKTVFKMGESTEEDGSLVEAKRKLMAAIRKWAELNGKSANETAEAVKRRSDYEETPGFFERVAREFEDES